MGRQNLLSKDQFDQHLRNLCSPWEGLNMLRLSWIGAYRCSFSQFRQSKSQLTGVIQRIIMKCTRETLHCVLCDLIPPLEKH